MNLMASSTVLCWSAVLMLGAALPAHAAPTDVYFDIRDYGATGDSGSSDRDAIQAAIDAAHAAGGGTVVVPSGTYRTGGLRLKDHVVLHLTPGAVLQGIEETKAYFRDIEAIVSALDATNIGITGTGEIRGWGDYDRGRRYGIPDADRERVHGIRLENCRNVTLRDFTIRYSTRFTLVLESCQDTVVDGVRILNNLRHLNSDGIHQRYCTNLRISNCHIEAGDDGIVLHRGAENLVITNCTVRSATTALKLGTGSMGLHRNIHFSNIVAQAPTGIGFYMKDGGTMENVTFDNISIVNDRPEDYNRTVQPIFMDIERRRKNLEPGFIRDVVFTNIHIRSGSGIVIQGMPERPIENVTMKNITFRADWADDYRGRRKAVGGGRATKDERDTLFVQQPTWAAFAYIDGLQIENVRVYTNQEAAAADRSELEVWASQDVVIDGVSTDASALPEAVVWPEEPAAQPTSVDAGDAGDEVEEE